jgi:rubredoxin
MAKAEMEKVKKGDPTHEHERVEVRSYCPECGQEFDKKSFDRKELVAQEVESQQGAALPNREAMSLVNANVAAPINAALALNVLSDGSIAVATATQYAPIDQSN